MYSTFVFLHLSPSDELSNKNLKINKLKLNQLSTITFNFFKFITRRHFQTGHHGATVAPPAGGLNFYVINLYAT